MITTKIPIGSLRHVGTGEISINHEQRHRLALHAWETINTERDLRGVLMKVADMLVPVVPFHAVAVIVKKLNLGRPYAMYLIGDRPMEGKEVVEFIHSMEPRPYPDRQPIEYEDPDFKRSAEDYLPYICTDLYEKREWYPHEFKLAAAGIRAYISIPLVARGELIGVVVFSRTSPDIFTPEQVNVLTDASRAVAVATAHALANEEICTLRNQLEEENIELPKSLPEGHWFEGIAGGSPAFNRVLEAVEQVAATDATVLIKGETGTGKELIARAIHQRSHRARGQLVSFNCAAIPETLLASELFGHERGAFTGAVERRKGRFEQAHGGTLFLDEIGELPPQVQVMLLRVLQESEFERLGGGQTVRVNVRIVAATNRDLAEEVRAGRFRSDLFYRLNVFPLSLPPLRERPEDISPLVTYFAAKYGERFGRAITRIERRTMKMLETCSWPGNVRELENTIAHAVILSRNGLLRIDRETMLSSDVIGGLEPQLSAKEREAIEAALRSSRGRIAGQNGAARRLGMAPSTLEYRIKRLGIDKFSFRVSR